MLKWKFIFISYLYYLNNPTCPNSCPNSSSIKATSPSLLSNSTIFYRYPIYLFRKSNTKTTSVGTEMTKYWSKVEKNCKTKFYPISSDINISHLLFVNSTCTSSAKFLNLLKKKTTCISKTTTSIEAICTYLLI